VFNNVLNQPDSLIIIMPQLLKMLMVKFGQKLILNMLVKDYKYGLLSKDVLILNKVISNGTIGILTLNYKLQNLLIKWELTIKIKIQQL